MLLAKFLITVPRVAALSGTLGLSDAIYVTDVTDLKVGHYKDWIRRRISVVE